MFLDGAGPQSVNQASIADTMTHTIVLPGGGYTEHAAHEGEPVVKWLQGLGLEASVFRYPLRVRHPVPLHALQAEIRRLRQDGVTRVGLIGFSAGGHLAGMAALVSDAGAYERVDFAVLGYAITSMETETYRPARLILLAVPSWLSRGGAVYPQVSGGVLGVAAYYLSGGWEPAGVMATVT
jgi:acetyl esterase/lipase